MSPKQPKNPKDIQIGANIRKFRLLAGMSQETLGGHLNLTFQQIQKYEKGTNRVSGGRLVDISNLFGISVNQLCGTDGRSSPNDNVLSELGGQRVGLQMATSFVRLPRPLQTIVAALVVSLAGQ